VAAVALVPAAIAAPAPRGGDNGSFGQAFFFTGAEQTFVVPDGVHTVHVIAVAAPGAAFGATSGGRPARVEGDLSVDPGDTLYVEVGGPGSATDESGGFNGGGDGGEALNHTIIAGGGGGASDVRLVSRDTPGSLDTRQIVAAGGGGAGGSGRGPTVTAGGAGGDAGAGGASGTGFGAGGGGGGAAGTTGGAVGGAGNVTTGFDGEPGLIGELGLGGEGADTDNTPGGFGGGGGGGLAGGGGGGSGAVDASGQFDGAFGGGGGGGGSSLVPPGGTGPTVVDPTKMQSRVAIAYVTPGTTITSGPQGTKKTKKRRISARYRFESSQHDSTFECSLDGKPFSTCDSPKRVSLGKGKHRFEVRAISAIGNTDPTPAVRKLKVVRRK
jgi:hypothetical protein